MVVDAANAAEIGVVEDVAGYSTFVAPVRAPPLTTEQIHWDGKDAHIFALVKQLRMLGTYFPLCIRQEMRLMLLTSGYR